MLMRSNSNPTAIPGSPASLGLLWLALAMLLTTRLALVLGLDVNQWSDLAWYLGRAEELLRTGRYAEHGTATAFWPVGYPAFLAAVMWLTQPTALAGQIANVLLCALSQVLLYVWCRQRFGDPRIAGLAAILLALYPNHMGYSVGLYSEPLFTTLLLAIFVLVRPQASIGRVMVAGVVAGLATLVKAQMLLLGPLLLLLLSLPEVTLTGVRQAIGRAALASMLMALTIAPWTYRNLQVMGAPIPVSTNGGMSLLAGNNPSMTTRLDSDFNDRDPLVAQVRFSVADQVAADQRARAAAWGWIRENPARFVALMPKKLFRLWALDGESEWLFQAGYGRYEANRLLFRSARVVNQAYYVLLLAGFAWAWRQWLPRNNPSAWSLPMMLAFFSVLSMVFSGQSRYHAPLMPFVIAFAAWTIVNIRSKGSAS